MNELLTSDWTSVAGFVALMLGLLVTQKQSVSLWLQPKLNLLGERWKTALGLAWIAAIEVAAQYGWVDGGLKVELSGLGWLLFGIGILHKETRVP